MATRKAELALGYRSNIRPTDLQPIVSQEKDVLTDALKTANEISKKSGIDKNSGAKTVVTYFHQVPSDRNNYLVNVSGLSDADPNLTQYIKIDKFTIKLDALDTSWEEGDNGGPKSPNFEGKLIISPNTILPYANDRFTMPYQERTRLFRVTEATPTSANAETAYELSCVLEDNDFVFEGSLIQTMVVDEYVFEENHVGSEFRTVFRKSEYQTLYDLKYLYHGLAQTYIENFYNKIMNTYLLRYNNNLAEEEQYVSPKFTVLTADGKTKPGVINPIANPEFALEYSGRDMYDPELIEFIVKNDIFTEEINYNRLIPTKFTVGKKDSSYRYTIFDALENRNRTRFKKKYQMPIELNIASPAAQPVMFGKISLLHVPSPADGILTLLPRKLPDVISATTGEIIPALDFRDGNVYDKIMYMIALYINKFDKHITPFLLSIYRQLDELQSFEKDVMANEVFYLYPIIAYIIKEVLEELVSKETVNKLSDPRDYYPHKKKEK